MYKIVDLLENGAFSMIKEDVRVSFTPLSEMQEVLEVAGESILVNGEIENTESFLKTIWDKETKELWEDMDTSLPDFYLPDRSGKIEESLLETQTALFEVMEVLNK